MNTLNGEASVLNGLLIHARGSFCTRLTHFVDFGKQYTLITINRYCSQYSISPGKFWDFLMEALTQVVYDAAQIMIYKYIQIPMQYVKYMFIFTYINIYSKKVLHIVRYYKTSRCFSDDFFSYHRQ